MRTITNYTVRWYSAEGKASQEGSLETLEQAQELADRVRQLEGTQQVLILRSGRHPRSPRWKPTRPVAKAKLFDTSHWTEPIGFVDTERDKHGPPVHLPVTEYREQPRTHAEKIRWAEQNPNPFPNAWPAYR